MNLLLKIIAVSIVASAAMLACGNSSPVPLSPLEAIEANKAPWDSLKSQEERSKYTNLCEDATKTVVKVSDWPLFDSTGNENPENIGGNRYIAIVVDNPTDWNEVYALQYRMVESERVIELAADLVGEEVYVDYEIKRGLDTGKISLSDDESEISALASGEFFCVYR